jgi:hypothetical protein
VPIASFQEWVTDAILAIPAWAVAALITVPVSIVIAAVLLRKRVSEPPKDSALPGMRERFERVADSERFGWVCQTFLGMDAAAVDQLRLLLRQRTRYASCGSVGGFADSEDDPAAPGTPRIVLALAPWAHASFLADMMAAHELFHLARHCSGRTPFPTAKYGALRRLGEEILVWWLTGLHSPGRVASLLVLLLAALFSVGFVLAVTGAWLLGP